MFELESLTFRRRRLLRAAAGAVVLGGSGFAAAQPVPGVASAPAILEGQTFDAQRFTLASQRGKVVMVLFWSTGCAVCRDLMPELRANHAGWAGKPFELVTVSTDARRIDALDYERLLERIVPLTQRFPSLWRPDPDHKDSFGVIASVPTTFVIDPAGRVVEQYVGRIPPAAWDRVAELLP